MKKIRVLLGSDYSKVYFMLAIFIIASLLDLVGLSFIALFINTILGAEKENIIILQNTYFMENYESSTIILIVGFALLCFYILKMLFGVFVNKTVVTFCQSRQKLLANKLSMLLIDTNPLTAIKRKSSYYVQNIQILTDSFAKQVLLPIFRVCSDGLIAFVLLAFLAIQNLLAFGLIVVIVFTAAYSYDRFFRQIQNTQGKISNDASEKVIQNVEEIFSGLTEIKLFSKERFFTDKMTLQTEAFSDATAKGLIVATTPRYTIELVLMTCLVSVYSLLSLTKNTQVEILSTLGVYAFASMRIVPLANSILSAVSELRLRLNTVERLYKELGAETIGNEVIPNEKLNSNSQYEQFNSFEFKNVSFCYHGSQPIFENLKLKVNSGELIALVGESGSGKSTILSLILGFSKPNSGSILLNSNTEYDEKYFQKNCSYSPQTPFCVSGTVFENVSLQSYDARKENDVMHSLLQSGFIKNCDSSILQQEIAPGGSNLSGGQLQRLALARAFFFDRDILLLDEMTSSLDQAMEKSVFAALKKMKGKKTIIVSTHSVDELDGFDRILQVMDGSILERFN